MQWSAWISQLQNLTETLEQADYRVRAGAHSADRVWPTGFDRPRRAPQRRLPLRRPDPAGRCPGPGQDDLDAPGRPQHRPRRPLRARVLLRARPADLPDPPGGPGGRPDRRHRRPGHQPDPGQRSRPPTAWATGSSERLVRHQRRRRGHRDRQGVRRPPRRSTARRAAPRRSSSHQGAHRRRSRADTGTAPFVMRRLPAEDADARERLDEERAHHALVDRSRTWPSTTTSRSLARRGLRQGGHSAAASGCATNHMRGSSALAYEADTVLDAEQQVRRRRPPPPRLRLRQRRRVPALGGPVDREEPQRPSTASTWSSASASTRAATRSTASSSREKLVDERVFTE